MGQRHQLLLPDYPTPRRLTPPANPCPPRHTRRDPRNIATRKSWHRPADHACATAPHPAANQGNRVDGHTQSPIHGFRLRRQVVWYVALMGVTWLFDVPALVRAKVPNSGPATRRTDPAIKNDESVRAPLQMLTNVLNLWESRDVGSALAGLA